MDAKLIDALKQALGYTTDVEVAGFLGVDKQMVYQARHGISSLGQRQRFKIIDRVLYRRTENLALRCLPANLVKRILELRKAQYEGWALSETEEGDPLPADAQLLDLYKQFRNLRTDAEMAKVLGIKRQSISMVRTGRSKLGPLPRLRIFRDVWQEDIADIEVALESSEALLEMINNPPLNISDSGERLTQCLSTQNQHY